MYFTGSFCADRESFTQGKEEFLPWSKLFAREILGSHAIQFLGEDLDQRQINRFFCNP